MTISEVQDLKPGDKLVVVSTVTSSLGDTVNPKTRQPFKAGDVATVSSKSANSEFILLEEVTAGCLWNGFYARCFRKATAAELAPLPPPIKKDDEPAKSIPDMVWVNDRIRTAIRMVEALKKEESLDATDLCIRRKGVAAVVDECAAQIVRRLDFFKAQ